MKKGLILLLVLILSLLGISYSYSSIDLWKKLTDKNLFWDSFFQTPFFQDPFFQNQTKMFDNFEKYIQNNFDSLFTGFNKNLKNFDWKSSFYSQSVILRSNKLVLEISTDKKFLENLETKFKTFCQKNSISLNIDKKSNSVKFIFESDNISKFYDEIMQIVSDLRSDWEPWEGNESWDQSWNLQDRGIKI